MKVNYYTNLPIATLLALAALSSEGYAAPTTPCTSSVHPEPVVIATPTPCTSSVIPEPVVVSPTPCSSSVKHPEPVVVATPTPCSSSAVPEPVVIPSSTPCASSTPHPEPVVIPSSTPCASSTPVVEEEDCDEKGPNVPIGSPLPTPIPGSAPYNSETKPSPAAVAGPSSEYQSKPQPEPVKLHSGAASIILASGSVVMAILAPVFLL